MSTVRIVSTVRICLIVRIYSQHIRTIKHYIFNIYIYIYIYIYININTALAYNPLSYFRIFLLQKVLKLGNETIAHDKCFVSN